MSTALIIIAIFCFVAFICCGVIGSITNNVWWFLPGCLALAVLVFTIIKGWQIADKEQTKFKAKCVEVRTSTPPQIDTIITISGSKADTTYTYHFKHEGATYEAL